jgi:hypothetical protein
MENFVYSIPIKEQKEEMLNLTKGKWSVFTVQARSRKIFVKR